MRTTPPNGRGGTATADVVARVNRSRRLEAIDNGRSIVDAKHIIAIFE